MRRLRTVVQNYGLILCFLIYIALFECFTARASVARVLSHSSEATINLTSLLTSYTLLCGYDYLCNKSVLPASHTITQNYSHLNLCPICSCDSQCLYNGNCCPDVYFKLPPLSCRNVNILDTRNGTSYQMNYLVVDSCPVNADKALARKCNGDVELAKKLVLPPVTSKSYVPLTFMNRHCAECNGVHNYSEWRLAIECELLADFNFLSSYEEIINLSRDRRCLVTFAEGEIPAPSCTATPPDASKEAGYYRICNKTKTWWNADPDVKTACESPYNVWHGNFKNVFCFLCNPPVRVRQKVTRTCNETGMWKPFDQSLQDACISNDETVSTFPYKNIFCYLCNRNTTSKENYLDVDVYISVSEEIPKNEFKYLLNISKYRLNYLLRNVLWNDMAEAEVVSGGSAHEQDVYSTPEIYRTGSQTVNMINLMMTSVATNGMGACSHNILPKSYRKFYLGHCTCKPMCRSSCCYDYALTYPVTCISADVSNLKRKQGRNKRYQVIKGCRKDRGTSVFNSLCTNPSPETDIFQFLPLSSAGASYRNIYCFICNLNGVHNRHNITESTLSDVEPWGVEVRCKSYLNHVSYLLLSDVIKAALDMSCEVRLKNTQMQPETDECHVPEYDIGKCNVTGTWITEDPDVRWACENTESYRLPAKENNGKYFKNEFCMLCNPPAWSGPVIDKCNTTGLWQRLDETSAEACREVPQVNTHHPFKNVFCKLCNGVPLPSSQDAPEQFPRFPTFPAHGIDFDEIIHETRMNFRNLFALTDFDQEYDTIMEDSCHRNQFFDEIKGTCRNLTCFPGKALQGPGCEPLISVTRYLRYVMTIKLNLKLTSSLTGKEVLNLLQTALPRKLSEVLGIQSTDLLIYKMDMLMDRPCHSRGGMNGSQEAEVLMYFQFFINTLVPRLHTEELLLKFMSQQLNISSGFDEIVILDVEKSEEARMTPIHIHEKIFEDKCHSSINGSQGPFITNFKTANVADLLLCPQIEFDSNEYVITGNKLKLRHMGVVLSDSDFLVTRKGKVRVCLDRVSRFMKRPISRDNSFHVLASLTFACLILSITCLFFTFVTYCVFSKLRTVPGKNNMCLMFALFFAQVGMLIQSQTNMNYMMCQLTGVFVHYFWLCAFGCLGICSFHMCRVFSGNFKTMLVHSTVNATILKPVLFSYGVPAILVLVNVFTSLGFTSGKNFGYGGSHCFITNKVSFIVTLLVPLIAMCVSSIIFFSYTSYHIRKSPKVQKNVTDKYEYAVYVKLFVVTGSTWLLQVLDSFLPLSFLSYIAAILNGSQGIFIFLSYVCNRRVFAMYRNLCSGSGNGSSTSNRSTNSTQKTSSNNTSTRM